MSGESDSLGRSVLAGAVAAVLGGETAATITEVQPLEVDGVQWRARTNAHGTLTASANGRTITIVTGKDQKPVAYHAGEADAVAKLAKYLSWRLSLPIDRVPYAPFHGLPVG